ncbi:unnamed protein product [Urochloa decumbens]|uniref:F-box domain-containing protein n=1 Tax=Urochloa decumbens TaxID=240449 RepID=A0ABC9B1X2_9POAL
MDVDMSASLPTDLLVDILRCLDATDLIHCPGVCKLWRHAIIGYASSLRPHPDRFNPNLLLGFFHQFRLTESGTCNHVVRVQRVPGPFQSAVPVAAGDTLPSLISAATGNLSLYETVLSSRDGFLLLDGQETDNLCLCNPMTGHCTFLPEVDKLIPDTYVLITGEEVVNGFLNICYQFFSAKDGNPQAPGAWGPVKRSPEFTKRLVEHWVWPRTEAISFGTIHWLGKSYTPIDGLECALAVDMRSSLSWMTDLPLQCQFGYDQLILATSGDGRLSLIRKPYMQTWVQVWVLVGADQWTMQHFIDVPILRSLSHALSPRSGFLHVEVDVEEGQVQELLVDVKTGSSRSIRCFNPDNVPSQQWMAMSVRDGLVDVPIKDEAFLGCG